MSRAQFAHDSDSNIDSAQDGYEQLPQASDPFGPVGAWQGSTDQAQSYAAPVYATPSIAPSQRMASHFDATSFDATSFDATSFEDDEPIVAPKKATWKVAVAALVLLGGMAGVGVKMAQDTRAEELRVAEIEEVRLRMAELDAKRRAEEAARPTVVADAAPTSSVAALLAASTNSNGAAGIPEAEKPRGLAAARQAAAIKRALSQPGVSRRVKAKGRGAGSRERAPKDDSENLQENSNDPIYGL